MAEMQAESAVAPMRASFAIAGRNTRFGRCRSALPFLVAAGLMLAAPALAQQSGTKDETIAPFGSHMTVQKQDKGIGLDGVLTAIRKSKTTAQDVKILSKLDKARIVHLGKALDDASQKKVESAVTAHRADVNALQLALEGNALTYAALNAQSISTSDIVGAEVSGDRQKTITIFARH